MKFIELDFTNHVAISEDGGIYGIEDYLDELEDPCYYEDALYVCIRVGTKCQTFLIPDIIEMYDDEDY